MISVRAATALDLDWIMEELPVFANHYGTRNPPFGAVEYVKETTSGLIQNHLVLVAECTTRGLLGFIFGIVGPHFYNPALRTLTELFWWVPERFRKTRAAVLLLNEFTAWGIANCDWVTFGIMETTPVKESSILKRGYIPYERAYLLEVRGCQS